MTHVQICVVRNRVVGIWIYIYGLRQIIHKYKNIYVHATIVSIKCTVLIAGIPQSNNLDLGP